MQNDAFVHREGLKGFKWVVSPRCVHHQWLVSTNNIVPCAHHQWYQLYTVCSDRWQMIGLIVLFHRYRVQKGESVVPCVHHQSLWYRVINISGINCCTVCSPSVALAHSAVPCVHQQWYERYRVSIKWHDRYSVFIRSHARYRVCIKSHARYRMFIRWHERYCVYVRWHAQ